MSGRSRIIDDKKGFSSSSSDSSSPPRHHRRSSSPQSSSTRSRSRSRSPKRSNRRDEHRTQHIRDDERQREERFQRREDSPSDRSQDSSRSDKSSKGVMSSVIAVTGIKDDNIPRAPPPPRISKTAIQFGKPGTVARPGIHMKLAPVKPKSESTKKITVASAFNNDSDEEVEEMPPECKMRMRNIGRDTPTSSGPNSFGKTKQGFIDSKKLFEKSLREAAME